MFVLWPCALCVCVQNIVMRLSDLLDTSPNFCNLPLHKKWSIIRFANCVVLKAGQSVFSADFVCGAYRQPAAVVGPHQQHCSLAAKCKHWKQPNLLWNCDPKINVNWNWSFFCLVCFNCYSCTIWLIVAVLVNTKAYKIMFEIRGLYRSFWVAAGKPEEVLMIVIHVRDLDDANESNDSSGSKFVIRRSPDTLDGNVRHYYTSIWNVFFSPFATNRLQQIEKLFWCVTNWTLWIQFI